MLVAFEFDGVGGTTVIGHDVRSGANRVVVEGFGVFFHDVLRHDLDRRQAFCQNTGWVFQGELHARVIDFFYRVDEINKRGVQRLVGFVHHALKRVDDVVGSDIRAVGEFRALAQFHGGLGAVAGFRQFFSQCCIGGAIGLIQLSQTFQGVPVSGNRQCSGGGHRVIAVGAQLVGNGSADGALFVNFARCCGISTGITAGTIRRGILRAVGAIVWGAGSQCKTHAGSCGDHANSADNGDIQRHEVLILSVKAQPRITPADCDPGVTLSVGT